MQYYDPMAFATYERFQLFQYNVETTGLYYASGQYYILCPNSDRDTTSIDGKGTIHHWLDENRIIGVWITIVSVVPDGAIRIDEYIYQAKPVGTGYLITIADIAAEINLIIPSIFPDYQIIEYTPAVVINFIEPITEDGTKELDRLFKENSFPLKVKYISDPSRELPEKEELAPLFAGITSARKVRKKVSANLAQAWEKDEDTWATNRQTILNNPSSFNYRPESLSANSSRGLVDCSIFQPDDIRNYLSLFEQICLVPPGMGRIEDCLKSLGVTQRELVGLVEMGKVQLMLPNSVDKYDLPFIEEALAANSGNLHFTRTINTLTIQENRKRNPFLFPAISTAEKQLLLRMIDHSISSLPADAQIIAKSLIAETGHGWVSLPNAINDSNSTMLSGFGIVNVLDPILKYRTGKDLKIELMVAAPSVELAAATGATLMPCFEPDADISPFCELIANFYSGVPFQQSVVPNPGYANFAVEQIFAISKHVPVIEFATTFNSSEINRFRELVLTLSEKSTSPEDLEETIEAYNYFVKQYEKDKKRLSAWNLRGFLLNQVGKATGLTYGSWALKFLTNTILKHGSKIETVGKVLDAIEAQIQGAYPSAILISKMKDKIKSKI